MSSKPRNRFPSPVRLYRMASRSCVGSGSPAIATRSSSASMLLRHSTSASAVRSLTQVDDLERPIGALDESLDARFHLAQFLRGRAKTGHALLEQREGSLELDPIRLELTDDLL